MHEGEVLKIGLVQCRLICGLGCLEGAGHCDATICLYPKRSRKIVEMGQMDQGEGQCRESKMIKASVQEGGKPEPHTNQTEGLGD